MTTFTCNNCNYSTTDKSNYRRHMRSKTHVLISQSVNLNQNIAIQNPDNETITVKPKKPKKTKKVIVHKCECGKIFSHQPSLSRHRKTCTVVVKENDMDNLKEQVNDIKNMMMQLLEKPSGNNHYNISVRTYIQQNYPDAPMIEEPTSYAKLNYENQELIDTLIYKYKHKCLHEYLGDFLVEYYKKDDPSTQSIWSSDISRLTYLIKEALVDKKSIWNHDYKGVKTKKYIVEPLLQYVKKYIASYWEKNLNKSTNKKKEVDVDALAKRQADYNITYAIESDIDNGIMANDIIKYIASHFRMDKHTANITFIDHDQEDDE